MCNRADPCVERHESAYLEILDPVHAAYVELMGTFSGADDCFKQVKDNIANAYAADWYEDEEDESSTYCHYVLETNKDQFDGVIAFEGFTACIMIADIGKPIKDR